MELDRLAGNARLKHTLSGRMGKLPQACLISGPRGSGRHTLAGILCQAMVCQQEEGPCGRCAPCRKVAQSIHPDVTRITGETEGKPITVDQVRQLRADAYIRPNEGERKVYVLEGVDTMRSEAQNAMLKLLEEGPVYAAFVLLCENPGGVLETIRSRCQQLPLTPVTPGECLAYLKGRFPQQSEEALRRAARDCQGLIGRGIEELEGGGQADREALLSLAHILESGDELTVLEALQSREKMGRDELTALFSALEAELVGRIPGSRDPRRCLRCVELLRQLRGAAALNVNPGQLLGWLCAGLFESIHLQGE